MTWTSVSTWATSFEQLWHSPAFPMWVTLAAGVFFALVLLITLFRAERSVANGALTVITLLAIAVAVAATMRNFGETDAQSSNARAQPLASLPALSCLDGLAGDVVEAACERALFASADSSAAGVSYTAAQLTRLSGFGDEAASNKSMTPELSALRRAVERDRFGLVAHVLTVRDGCTPAECLFYKFLSDHNQVAANMNDRTYEGLIARYSPIWTSGALGPAVAATGALPPSMPTGKPMSGDFPTSTSIPAVSIMTPEPAASAATNPKPAAPPPTVASPPAAPRTAAAPPLTPPSAKRLAPKKNTVAPVSPPAPLPLAPPPQSDDN